MIVGSGSQWLRKGKGGASEDDTGSMAPPQHWSAGVIGVLHQCTDWCAGSMVSKGSLFSFISSSSFQHNTPPPLISDLTDEAPTKILRIILSLPQICVENKTAVLR